MNNHSEIVIIGAGIAGASLAYFLSPHRSIRLLERESAAGYHATGRSAAEFTLRFHGDVVGQLSLVAHPFFLSPPDGFSDVPLLKRRGNLTIANAEKAARLEQVFQEEQASPMPTPLERLTVAQALGKVPFLDPEYVADALYDPDCWDIEVGNLLQGYLSGAKQQGTEVLTDAELLGAKHDGQRWQLNTAQGEFTADILVNASGGWADSMAECCGVSPLSIIPHRRTAINVKVPDYDVSVMPEVNEVDEDFYFKPDAGQLMVSPADETPVDPHDAWPEEMDIAYAAHYLSECTTLEFEQVAHSWAGLRTFSQDRLPVVGYSAQQSNYFWLAGQGGYGIQTSPAIGRMAAALIQGQTLPNDMEALGLSAEQFSPARFGG